MATNIKKIAFAILLLTSLCLILYNKAPKYEILSKAEVDISTLSSMVKIFHVTSGNLPTNEQGLEILKSFSINGNAVSLIDNIPNDPWGRPYQYRYPSEIDPNKFDIYSLGEDGIKSSDDISNSYEMELHP